MRYEVFIAREDVPYTPVACTDPIADPLCDPESQPQNVARMKTHERMSHDTAETLALKGLAYLMSLSDDRDRFLALSGVDPADLHDRAGDPELLGAVLDFLLGNEQLLTEFCDGESLPSRDIHLARHVLAG